MDRPGRPAVPCALCGHPIGDAPVLDHGNAYHAFCAARRRKIVDAAERPITPRDAAALMAWYRRVMPEDAGRL